MADFWTHKLKSLRMPDEVTIFVAAVLRRVEHVWQRREKELRAVDFSLLEQKRAQRGLAAQYDIFMNTVEINPFMLLAALVLNDSHSLLMMEQIITHEIMHAFSYRRIVRADPRLILCSGVSVQIGNLEATEVFSESEFRLNEYITNYYSMRTMRAAPRGTSEQFAVHRMLLDTYDDVLVGEIEKIVGSETLYHAYFNGQTGYLLSCLLAGGVALEPFLAAIEKQDHDLTLALCFHDK